MARRKKTYEEIQEALGIPEVEPHYFKEQIDEFLDLYDGRETLAIDTETTGLAYGDRMFCATVAWRSKGEVRSSYLESEAVTGSTERKIQSILETSKLVLHNAKFDLHKLRRRGWITSSRMEIQRLDDTEILAHLDDPYRPKRLKYLAKELLGVETDEDTYLRKVRTAFGFTKKQGYDVLPRWAVIPYALKDAEFTLQLYERLLPSLDEELLPLYNQEKRLLLDLMEMEEAGMAVDLGYTRELVLQLGQTMVEAQLQSQNLVGKDFSISSNPQVAEAFRNRGYDLPNVRKDTLQELDDPLAEMVLTYRSAKKKRDYGEAILREHIDGILHPWFRQQGTNSGRMSSGEAEAD
jgi:DNA polymerase I-like protein with 3'-5' exonuclease and polymerase domains